MTDRLLIRAWDRSGTLCAKELHRTPEKAARAFRRLLTDPHMVWVEGPWEIALEGVGQ